MKEVSGKLLDIVTGRAGMSMSKVEAYRRQLLNHGYTLPPIQAERIPTRSNRRSKPKTAFKATPPRKSGCGCNKRKAVLNKMAPSLRLGDKVEALAKVTGIKRVVEAIYGKETELTWAYGLTTVPDRIDDLLPITLNSLAEAGFPSPRLFVDGAVDGKCYEQFGLEVTTRYPALRTAGNWVLSLYETFIREPTADRYAMFQDDFVTYQNLREYLERVDYPEKGYCNLYTFPSNQTIAPCEHGWFRTDQTGKGAVALVFSNEAARVLLASRHLADRPQCAKRGHRAIDGGIVESMKKAGWSEYCHNPSLVQHIGDVSSMGNKRHPHALSFMGEKFDALKLLEPK